MSYHKDETTPEEFDFDFNYWCDQRKRPSTGEIGELIINILSDGVARSPKEIAEVIGRGCTSSHINLAIIFRREQLVSFYQKDSVRGNAFRQTLKKD